MTTENIQLGAKVFLRICSGCGEPGTVIRQERRKLVVHWQDLDMESRHLPEALEIAKRESMKGNSKGGGIDVKGN